MSVTYAMATTIKLHEQKNIIVVRVVVVVAVKLFCCDVARGIPKVLQNYFLIEQNVLFTIRVAE